ncbi:hypothetical protein RMSM_05643 [Rhodopirellula maiorica SM1]|uniref:BON domain-containing protein n=1 Tax=Rhodopirellula maiorica SM1 TaxID=1265738 RepID=M5RTW9_9BACT|nr:BON domain-containing protein [Rhodopirellula maiorica]EMI17414.1 hypothetical protein RMSM_05643 [Rhodopirellula maiorica SM1]
MISTPTSNRRHPANSSPANHPNNPSLKPAAVVHPAHRLQGNQLEAALRKTGRKQLEKVGVTVEGRVVIMEGRVDSYVLKQIAQETLRPHLRGMTLRNRLVVSS